MATSKKILRETKMKTTEPMDDEVRMKKGGRTKKAMGGPMIPTRPMGMTPELLRRKKGGEVESKSENKAEKREIMKVEKELKHHEGEKAIKAHHGLKKGGMAKVEGLLGGLKATRNNTKKTTGNIEVSKFRKGGQALAKKMDSFETKTILKPKINIQDKVVDASHNKKLGHKTGKVRDTVDGEGEGGYKRGGKAHYAHGGHVAHHTTHGHGDHGHTHMHQHASKHSHGHDKIDGHPMKKGGHAAKHHKKGGKCNY
jgi:hypothetical protein